MQAELNFDLPTENEISTMEATPAETDKAELETAAKALVKTALRTLQEDGKDRLTGNVNQLLRAHAKSFPSSRHAVAHALRLLELTPTVERLNMIFGAEAFGLHVPELTEEARNLIDDIVTDTESFGEPVYRLEVLDKVEGMYQYPEFYRSDLDSAVSYLKAITEARFQEEFCQPPLEVKP